MGELSLGDVAALNGNDGLMGNGGIWIFALLILLMLGGGSFGNKTQGEFSQYATAASQNEILFGQQFQTLNQAVNKIGDGLSSLGYSQLQQMSNDTASINGNVVTEGRNIQTQISDCCCSTQRAVDAVKLDMANYVASINASVHAEGEATRSMIQQNELQTLRDQVNNLTMQNAINSATNGVVKYPMASTYTMGGNPFCASLSCSNAY